MSNEHLNLRIIAVVVFIIAILWVSLPIEASPGQSGSSGIETLDFSGLTLRCELEAGAVFTSLTPGPNALWHLSLLGDCAWQVNPTIAIVGRGHISASLPCLTNDPAYSVKLTAAKSTEANGMGTPMNAQAQDTGHIALSMDRLFLQYESGRTRAIIGKQAVNWGLAALFRPTDLITPRDPGDPGASGEGRPGKVLATLFWRTSPLTGVELVLGENLCAGRAEFRVGETNLGILGLTKRENPAGNEHAVGLDFQGGLRGFYGEICHRWTDTGVQNSGIAHSGVPAEMSTTSGTIGWKTMLLGGNLIFAEYYRNHVQLGSISAIAQLTALGLTYQYDEFTTFGIVGVTDLSDGGWSATGTLTSLLAENLDLNCGVSITRGPHAQAQVMLKWYL